MGTGRFRAQKPPNASGTYHLNWHARIHVSIEDPTWVMPWYFNFATDRGLALHQYALPGRTAAAAVCACCSTMRNGCSNGAMAGRFRKVREK